MNEPTEQFVQLVAAVEENFPAIHGVQTVLATIEAAVPAAHSIQSIAAEAL